MRKFYVFGAAAILACNSTFAQSENFTGFSSALGLKRIDNSQYADIYSSASYSADIQASYGISLSKDVILNFGVSLGLGSSEIIAYGNNDYRYSSKLKNAASIYIEPGFLVSDKTLLYTKISHETGKISVSFTDRGDDFAFSGSTSSRGLGIGFGIKTMLNDKMFFQFEIKKVGYSENLTQQDDYFVEGNRFNSTSGSIGIGYKF